MFSHNHAKNWNPYTIPATPNIPSGSSDVYSLSCEEGADGAKNPSQFLKWKKTTLPKGDELGDTLYWDPAKGEDGEWEVLDPPTSATEEAPQFISFDGENISWRESALPEGSNKGDLLQWDPEAGEEGAWVILAAPEDGGSILYWTGDAWQFIQPPETAEDQEKFFYWNGTDWEFADVKVFDVCENGEVKQYRIPAI